MASFKPAARRTVRLLVDRFAENNILTYASAIAFQLLIAVVALALLGLALIQLFGVESVWTDHLRPFFHSHFTPETSRAVEATAERIFRQESMALVVFAVLLAIWEVSGAVRAVMGALNEIYGTEEKRPIWRRFAVSFALAIALIVALVGALLAVSLRSAWPSAVPGFVAFCLSWGLGVVLLALAVWLLLRFAASTRRSDGWVTTGSFLVIVAWVLASVGIRYYVLDVANYRSALGNLAAVLTLTAYIYTSAIVFLVGAQVDELLRQQTDESEPSLFPFAQLARLRARRSRREASA